MSRWMPVHGFHPVLRLTFFAVPPNVSPQWSSTRSACADVVLAISVFGKEGTMNRERALKVVLVLVGLLFLAGVYPVTDSLWHANQPQGSLKSGQSRSLQNRPTVKARDIDVDGSPYRLCRHEQCLERRKETTSHRTGKARMVFTKDRARNRCTA